ncbi:phage tail protein I [Vreelandella venusta]|nr:phage tail protein I [Halomonas hydrothermalis]
MTDLLPLNRTALEARLAASQPLTLPVPLRTLCNPASCPAHCLPFLAWALSVDQWYESLPESIKRRVIANSGVKAYWNDTRGAARHTVLAGTDENAKQLRPTYATEDDALAAARAEWQRIQRGLAEFELTLALGRPDLLPETPLTLASFKPQIDATAWLVSEVTHSLNDGGMGTVVRCEVLKITH